MTDDNPKEFRNKSQTRRTVKKKIEPDNPNERTSNSYDKITINNKKRTLIQKERKND